MTKREQRKIPIRSLFPLVLITFGIAWGVLAMYIFLPDQMAAWFGELTGQHPLFYLSVYSPAIAAFSIVIYHRGIVGLRHFLARFLIWRCSVSWYLFLLLGVPLVFIAGSALNGNLFSEPYPFGSLEALLIALLLAVIKGPIEEFGWRGLALPLVQRRFAPVWAGLIVGVIWGLWHTPAFLLSGTQQSAWTFTPFFVGTIALSLIVTPMFNQSKGSIFLPALFHFQLINPIFPDAQPYDTYILIFIAGIIIFFNRKTMFTRGTAVTEVIPRDETENTRI